jgi:outer membrane protein assembly factor BamB
MFHAVDTATGKAKWTFKTGGEIKSSPVVFTDGGVEKVLIGSYDQSLYCLNAKTGAVLWKFSINGPVHATPSIASGIAYLTGCDEVFYGIRLADGKEVQHVASGAYTGASPALLLSPLPPMAFFGTFNNDVLAVNLTTKRIVWRYEHPQRHFPFYASAAVTPSLVIVGGRDKMVHALVPKPGTTKGKAAWTFLTKARVESSPAIAGTRVYVGSNDGTLYVLDLATGKKLWEFTAGAPISASPAIGGGRLVIGDQDGKLYCFGQ